MQGTSSSVASQLATERLGRDVIDWIGERREAGRSWRLIARDLHDATSVDVTGETLRMWAATDEAAS